MSAHNNRQKGFTLIEMLMVMLLVAILAAVAVPQFIDFRTEARNAATNSALGALRTAIVAQQAQMIVRCGAPAGGWPSAVAVNANNVTDASDTPPCVAWAPTPSAAEQMFMPDRLPGNPWSAIPLVGTIAANTVTACALNGCLRDGTKSCSGASAYTVLATIGGWCYDSSKGTIWANSANNDGLLTGTGTEYLY